MRNLFVPASIEKFSESFTATVAKKIVRNQAGQVKLLGSYWTARFFESNCQATVLPDELVTVVAMQGITLLVVPVDLQIFTKGDS